MSERREYIGEPSTRMLTAQDIYAQCRDLGPVTGALVIPDPSDRDLYWTRDGVPLRRRRDTGMLEPVSQGVYAQSRDLGSYASTAKLLGEATADAVAMSQSEVLRAADAMIKKSNDDIERAVFGTFMSDEEARRLADEMIADTREPGWVTVEGTRFIGNEDFGGRMNDREGKFVMDKDGIWRAESNKEIADKALADFESTRSAAEKTTLAILRASYPTPGEVREAKTWANPIKGQVRDDGRVWDGSVWTGEARLVLPNPRGGTFTIGIPSESIRGDETPMQAYERMKAADDKWAQDILKAARPDPTPLALKPLSTQADIDRLKAELEAASIRLRVSGPGLGLLGGVNVLGAKWGDPAKPSKPAKPEPVAPVAQPRGRRKLLPEEEV